MVPAIGSEAGKGRCAAAGQRMAFGYNSALHAAPAAACSMPNFPPPASASSASAANLITGDALARATALSTAPSANFVQSANSARDRHWFDTSVPCRTACPAGTDIPGYLEAVRHGEFAAAYRINLEDNVFPGVLGRVCSRPCEDACRHGAAGNGEPVAICFSKRSAADHGAAGLTLLPPLFAASGRTVAVIGAGVAGLACARELARFGHRVTVFEKHRAPGGMLIQGIPMFRLPRDVVEREIAQVAALGVDIRCGVAIGTDLSLTEVAATHDAVVLAAGTLKPSRPSLPGLPHIGAEHGLDFLLEVNEFGRTAIVKTGDPGPGRQVLIIGGGYTALDCARTALRLQAQVSIVYRRGRDAMVVLPGEIEEFLREGGTLHTQLAPLSLLHDDDGITGMRFIRTRAAAQRDGPLATIAGSELDIAADHVIFATGQNPDCSWLAPDFAALVGEDGLLASGKATASTQPKIFVAGDFALGATTLISAIGHARECAGAVDRFLTGSERVRKYFSVSPAAFSKSAAGNESPARISLTGRDAALNAIPLTVMPTAAPKQRGLNAEVELGYAAGAARQEASRCYLCHYKFEIIDVACVLCDECLRVRPVPDCIVEIAALEQDAAGRVTGYRPVERDHTDSLYYNRLWIDQSRCIRCGACEAVCPVNAITVQKVSCESSCG
jgi:NADPH-dependent glutamate synthase beta subunit-like oxidoreductase/NAD-dependent dihydropyrimidine dehydrogenase PreA subunit